MSSYSTTNLKHCLDRLHAGKLAARDVLIDAACDRLRRIVQTMQSHFRRLPRWQHADDVLQNALLRLSRSPEQVVPQTTRDYYRLATLQIRRELIDLTRHHIGPEGPAANHASNTAARVQSDATPFYEQPDTSFDLHDLTTWCEFHERVADLADEERKVILLVWYQGFPQNEAAEFLEVSTKTIMRRWHAACQKLHKSINGKLRGS